MIIRKEDVIERFNKMLDETKSGERDATAEEIKGMIELMTEIGKIHALKLMDLTTLEMRELIDEREDKEHE